MVNGCEESAPAIVARKPTNKAEQSAAESAERRQGPNAGRQSTRRAQNRVSVAQALNRVREVARKGKKERFIVLLQHISVALLRQAFYKLKRDAAPGVDGMTWADYEVGLEPRLADLHERVQRGAYRALPSRRG
jgi:RNA-directed DNA polymerase